MVRSHLSASAVIILVASLVGCGAPPYAVKAGVPTASMTFFLEGADSIGDTSTLYRVQAYGNRMCAPNPGGAVVAEKFYLEPGAPLGPVAVQAGKPLTFSVDYHESDFGEGRTCSYTGTFVPKKLVSYSVRLVIYGEIQSCEMKIEQSTGGKVEWRPVPYTCSEMMHADVRSGVACVNNWRTFSQECFTPWGSGQ